MIDIFQQDIMDLYDLTANVLERSLSQKTNDAGNFTIPNNAFNPLRSQYDAMSIINHVFSLNPGSSNMKLGLVDKDIYTHSMNFIFGLADPLSNTALVSTYRLIGEHKDARIRKEIVHEIGHLLGLKHCSDDTCVMYFSNTIDDTDRKNDTLCAECGRKLES